jgi:5'-nucleotidase
VVALVKLPKVKVTVVAPAEDVTGQSDKTTPGELTATETTLISGYEATAVAGFPADTINYALDELGLKPHVVLSGINNGQNIGVAVDASGTVGAAKTAVRRDIPALAVSQGFGEPTVYDDSVREAIKWVKKHRKALSKGSADVVLENLNVPTCTVGEVRGLVDVEVAPPEEVFPAESNCDSTLEDPTTDIEAFSNGFASIAEVPVS